MPSPYEIALWRYEQIAFLIDPGLDEAQRRAVMKERTTRPVPRPWEDDGDDGRHPPKARPIGRSTLYRWLAAYRAHGYAGLLPGPRADRGVARCADTLSFVAHAIGLLYEQPQRSLTQLEVYLRAEFPHYSLGRSTLRRHLHAHPAYAGIEKLRSGKQSRLRDLYEASHPHEGWQLDGKGPFAVRLVDGTRVHVHVLTVLDDHSRAVLAAHVALAEDTEAAIAVFKKAVARWGLAERFQFDRGSAFDSHTFRSGLAILGVHRNHVRAKSPEWQGKIEAYHRCLGRWFVRELAAQEVVDLVHLQQLLEATLELVYDQHHHREIGSTPHARLAGRISERQVSRGDLERAFFAEVTEKSDAKTGEVRLPTGSFRVPSSAYAGSRSRFRYYPGNHERAVLLTRDGREIELRPFTRKPLSAVEPRTERRGTGELQKLVDRWMGKERPNAQPGFGLPEVFALIGKALGREVPGSEREAEHVLAFYRKYGPLPRESFQAACERSAKSLGGGRPLKSLLADLERQIQAERGISDPREGNP